MKISFQQTILIALSISIAAPGLAGTEQRASVIVVAEFSKDARSKAPRRFDRKGVAKFLKDQSSEAYTRIQASLRSKNISEKDVQVVKYYWINNSFEAVITKKGYEALLSTDGVRKVIKNSAVGREPVVRSVPAEPPTFGLKTNALPYDFVDTSLDQLIEKYPQVTGRGVVLGHVDTGVDGDHEALKGKIISYYDGASRSITTPKDTHGHGTHTAGTMIGGDRIKTFIGMAPDASLVSSGPLAGYADILNSMQYMLDPDQNPDTNDVPVAVNNSWHASGAPDIELFYRAIDAWVASGILPVFSAGNAGPGDRTITKPKEHPSTLVVAATGEDGKITRFSSRGSTLFRGKEIQKPDLSAPGNNIYSSTPRGRYSKKSGTSMAAPHVAGAVALVKQVAPSLNAEQLKQIFMNTTNPVDEKGDAMDRGTWNKVYGFGKLNIFEAVKAAMKVEYRMRNRSMNLFSISTPEDQWMDRVIESANNPGVFTAGGSY